VTDVYEAYQEGRRRLRKGMAAQATVPLEKAKKLEPDKASIREALGIAYFRLRRWDEAEAEFRVVLELSPTDDYAHYALGRTLEKQGRHAEANGHYKLASSMAPGNPQYAERILDLEPRADEEADGEAE
jgi:Flp pilus assembly protein TadD